MSGDVFIDEHAFKHGLSPEDIEFAWTHFVLKKYRGKPDEGQIAAIGFDKSGRLIEMVAAERPAGTLFYHAMQPPTRRMLVELGYLRGTK